MSAYKGGQCVPGLSIHHPLTVSVYDDAGLLKGLPTPRLQLYAWNGRGWQNAACGPAQQDLQSQRRVVPLCRLNRFARSSSRPLYLPGVQRG